MKTEKEDKIIRKNYEKREETKSSDITINNPKIVEFFKDNTQDEIEDIIVSFIDFSNKCSKINDKNNHLNSRERPEGADTNIVVNHNEANNLNEKEGVEEKTVSEYLKIGMTEDEKTEVIKINKYILHEINKEYQEFIRNKDALIGLLKENGKHSFSLLYDIKMPYLEKYMCETCDTELSTKLQLVNQFKCEICNYYICNTKKALSAHQRGCKRNMVNM